MTDPFAIALISALVGAGIAGFATWYAARYAFAEQEKATQRRAAQEKQTLIYNVTTLLHQEIEANRKLLGAYLHDATHGPGGRSLEGMANEIELQERRRLVELPFPHFGYECWSSQLAHVPSVLEPTTLRDAYDFYDQLKQLTAARLVLVYLLKAAPLERYDAWSELPKTTHPTLDQFLATPVGSTPKITLDQAINDFVRHKFEIWAEYKGAINELLGRGNPVPEPPEPTPIPPTTPTSPWTWATTPFRRLARH